MRSCTRARRTPQTQGGKNPTLSSLFETLLCACAGCAPIFRYPVQEGTTGNAVLLLTQVFCTVLTAFVSVVSAQDITFAMFATSLVCLVAATLVQSDYRRKKASD